MTKNQRQNILFLARYNRTKEPVVTKRTALRVKKEYEKNHGRLSYTK